MVPLLWARGVGQSPVTAQLPGPAPGSLPGRPSAAVADDIYGLPQTKYVAPDLATQTGQGRLMWQRESVLDAYIIGLHPLNRSLKGWWPYQNSSVVSYYQSHCQQSQVIMLTKCLNFPAIRFFVCCPCPKPAHPSKHKVYHYECVIDRTPRRWHSVIGDCIHVYGSSMSSS